MDKQKFWALIEKSKGDEQVPFLLTALSQMPEQEVIDFECIFQSYMNDSYQSRLWGAAFILMGGCSDDAFDYFRGWLIGQGESVFNHVMEDHEYLAVYIDDETLDDAARPQNEELIFVGIDSYMLMRTGDTIWDDAVHDELMVLLMEKGLALRPDIENDWKEEDLELLYPRLWSRFGEEPLC